MAANNQSLTASLAKHSLALDSFNDVTQNNDDSDSASNSDGSQWVYNNTRGKLWIQSLY